ncbi:PREDICTED: protein shisa-5-like isoform X2 [Dinoponera quadriceps]|uniref:Protein shisa-5-like isoform X2 n=1 Tax=Dinoponera quadriceps TaxID=609295 RepID=A0A6P3X4P2_DINQU|nr:PREDICTED: protein shisa-5-like isoform X2 [Dinoponera quadriceps]
MSRFAGALLLLCLHAGFAHGMDCNFGTSKNFIEKTLNSCPGFLDNPSKSYCCVDIANERTYCCTAEEFALKTGLGIVVPVIIVAAIIISLIVCCISCLCCSCCPWYRRRHRGTVYGKVQAPNVVHVVQSTPNVPPSYASQENQNHYVPYPTNPAGFPQHPPPQYTSEAYAKQAPYNPAYPPQ